MTTTLLAGFFALAGALGAQLVSALSAKRSHDRTTAAADERRWLVDRRTVYAQYLALASLMTRDASRIRGRLRNTIERPWTAKDAIVVSQMIRAYLLKWGDELQPLMEEVQLLALRQVAENSLEVLLKLGDLIDPMEHCVDLTEAFFMAGDDVDSIDLRDMNEVREDLTRKIADFSDDLRQVHKQIRLLRDAMRIEIGLPPIREQANPIDSKS